MKIAKAVLQYALSLAFAIWLFWLVYRDTPFSLIWSNIEQADLSWVWYSIGLSIIANLLRAYRWNLIIEPLGYKLSTPRTFLAVMGGYFVNLLLPRAGEITRCVILRRTDRVPFAASFGTVITERVIDLTTLLSLVVAALIIEYSRIYNFFYDLFIQKVRISAGQLQIAGTVAVVLIAAGIFGFWILRRSSLWDSPAATRIRGTFVQVWEGMVSIRNIRSKRIFLLTTLAIWVLYFFMSYLVFFSFVGTSHLSLTTGLSVLVMGGLGMSAPVQGGVGTFHVLVASLLVLYGVDPEVGKSFAFLLHSSGALTFIVVGGVSLLLSFIISPNKAKPDK